MDSVNSTTNETITEVQFLFPIEENSKDETQVKKAQAFENN